MDSHGAKRSAEPNMYEQLANKIWRPNVLDEELSTTTPPPPPPPPPPPLQSQSQTQPEGSNAMGLTGGESTANFHAEVLNALYCDTTGHPEHGSLSYHKAAERYALTGDGHWPKRLPAAAVTSSASSSASSGSQQWAHLPPPASFERAARALYERNKLAARQHNNNSSSIGGGNSLAASASDNAGLAGRASPSPSSINELSHIYLQLLQQQLPQQQAQQQQHLVAGAPSNMSMPIYGLACGQANDITQVYAHLLTANLRQNVAQQQQQQQQQSSSVPAAAIIYEAILQQRVLQQLQQQQMQQRAQQQQQQHQHQQQQHQQQQQQQQSRTPRGIYGGNYNLSGVHKTTQPDNK